MSIKKWIAGGIALMVTMPQTVCVEPHRQRDHEETEFREATLLEAPFRFAVGTSREQPTPYVMFAGVELEGYGQGTLILEGDTVEIREGVLLDLQIDALEPGDPIVITPELGDSSPPTVVDGTWGGVEPWRAFADPVESEASGWLADGFQRAQWLPDAENNGGKRPIELLPPLRFSADTFFWEPESSRILVPPEELDESTNNGGGGSSTPTPSSGTSRPNPGMWHMIYLAHQRLTRPPKMGNGTQRPGDDLGLQVASFPPSQAGEPCASTSDCAVFGGVCARIVDGNSVSNECVNECLPVHEPAACSVPEVGCVDDASCCPGNSCNNFHECRPGFDTDDINSGCSGNQSGCEGPSGLGCGLALAGCASANGCDGDNGCDNTDDSGDSGEGDSFGDGGGGGCDGNGCNNNGCDGSSGSGCGGAGCNGSGCDGGGGGCDGGGGGCDLGGGGCDLGGGGCDFGCRTATPDPYAGALWLLILGLLKPRRRRAQAR